MSDLLKTLSLIALVAGVSPAFAQDDTAAPSADASSDTATETDADADTEDGANAAVEMPESDLSMGEPAQGAQGQEPQDGPGSTYVAEDFNDWQMRCVRTEDGKDPCQLYQLLRDDEGNSVAEMSVFPLPQAQGQAVAGATIITPLETLLTQQLTIAVDGGEPRRYPYTFCNPIGCFARVGFTEAELNGFRRGASANMSLVPAAAPDQRVTLNVSLSGFTAGYDAVGEANAE
ncbi:invasion associated locus B family protein [Mesobaculum littorinae]|uniref:Invasion associated locus B family protein n=1 Tax=Mesobaculum littorinae TaxID=2486419 RepID=A0A438AMB3_9RHOB|nr:invasion associated locus B family protein [Mesobaculum littorinae]RVV99727.1 invasion associated locus B family protein [Mesobaculum littorinae]